MMVYPLRVVKLSGAYIASPIATIINKSFTMAVVPSTWKLSNVIPIEKKKGSVELNNFRPISILPVLSKVLEKSVYFQLLSHLEYYYLLSTK